MNFNIDLSSVLGLTEYNKMLEMADLINNNNGRLYLVGGCVRDILLNIPPHDFDYCVVGFDSSKFENLFSNAIKQGKSFPVYILNNSEFALARKEIKTGSKHTDFSFETDASITIQDDLIRRDLTINSIAIDILTNEVIDMFNGINDIKNKVLKATSQAFIEDPLRVYRVARFASQLNFNVDTSTLEIMETMKNDLLSLSPERVFTEFRKALISDNPTRFFEVLKSAECLEPHFKEIYNLIGVEQPLKYHPEGDVYNHTIEVLDRVSKATNDELIRFSGLVHDFGKAATPHENWPHHYDHDKLGVSIIKEFCHKLKMPTSYLKAGCTASSEHMLAGIYDRLKPSTKIKLFERVYKSKFLSLHGLEIIANADKIRETPIKFADIGTKIMQDIKIDKNDKVKISNSKNDKNYIEKIKYILQEKRIKYLLELEKNTD